jgi:hypothetical protein
LDNDQPVFDGEGSRFDTFMTKLGRTCHEFRAFLQPLFRPHMGTTLTLTIDTAQTKANLYELLMGCTRRVTPIEAIGQYVHLDSPPDRIQMSRFVIFLSETKEYHRCEFGAKYGLTPSFEIDFAQITSAQWDLAMLEVAQITKMIFTEYLFNGIIGFDYGTMFLWRSPEGLWTSPTDKPPAAFMEVFKGLTLERDIPQM